MVLLYTHMEITLLTYHGDGLHGREGGMEGGMEGREGGRGEREKGL